MQHGANLDLDRCPHCEVAKPLLIRQKQQETSDHSGNNKKLWGIYMCKSCGGLVTAYSHAPNQFIQQIWPTPKLVSGDIPDKAREFMTQAIACIHAPAGAVMLAASAVDAMLKEKGLKEGNLYKRIDEAAAQHLITKEMAIWAHEIRLDANDQRHADEDAPLPDSRGANKAVDFAMALGQFLFVLPAQVTRGRKA